MFSSTVELSEVSNHIDYRGIKQGRPTKPWEFS